VRRLRNSNVKSVLNKFYLWCGYDSRKPMLHHLLCEKSCKKYNGEKYNDCIYYKEWYYTVKKMNEGAGS